MEAGQAAGLGQFTKMERNLFDDLRAALKERLLVIGDKEARESNPTAHLERLKTASQAISKLQAELPKDADARLRHYLDRCSYDKALEWIDAYRE